MALTAQQTSFALYVRDKAAHLIEREKPDIEQIIAQWFQNGYSGMDNAELVEATGITMTQLTDAVVSLIDIQEVIGDFQTGAAVGLSKIVTLGA